MVKENKFGLMELFNKFKFDGKANGHGILKHSEGDILGSFANRRVL